MGGVFFKVYPFGVLEIVTVVHLFGCIEEGELGMSFYVVFLKRKFSLCIYFGYLIKIGVLL